MSRPHYSPGDGCFSPELVFGSSDCDGCRWHVGSSSGHRQATRPAPLSWCSVDRDSCNGNPGRCGSDLVWAGDSTGERVPRLLRHRDCVHLCVRLHLSDTARASSGNRIRPSAAIRHGPRSASVGQRVVVRSPSSAIRRPEDGRRKTEDGGRRTETWT